MACLLRIRSKIVYTARCVSYATAAHQELFPCYLKFGLMILTLLCCCCVSLFCVALSLAVSVGEPSIPEEFMFDAVGVAMDDDMMKVNADRISLQGGPNPSLHTSPI